MTATHNAMTATRARHQLIFMPQSRAANIFTSGNYRLWAKSCLRICKRCLLVSARLKCINAAFRCECGRLACDDSYGEITKCSQQILISIVSPALAQNVPFLAWYGSMNHLGPILLLWRLVLSNDLNRITMKEKACNKLMGNQSWSSHPQGISRILI